MKIFFLIPFLLGFFSPVRAGVDKRVAEFCLRAKDFEGCVRSMSSKSSDMPSMRIIEGGVELSGNSCPNDFVYVGAGSCRNYILNTRTRLTIDGVGIWRAGHVSKPRWNYYYKLGEVTKAIYDPKLRGRKGVITTQEYVAKFDLDQKRIEEYKDDIVSTCHKKPSEYDFLIDLQIGSNG